MKGKGIGKQSIKINKKLYFYRILVCALSNCFYFFLNFNLQFMIIKLTKVYDLLIIVKYISLK